MGGYWWANGGFEGRLIEIERAKPQAADFIVDVNRADWPELAQLPGIGETLAKRIVEVRTSGGPFRDHEEVQLRVRGIGPKTLQKIKPYLAPIADDAMVAGK
ncbi:MAG: helix-hairpin-helix domain-containing protein [Planctomycetes bacterium]|nr:helix-hairpin-helix domain-containing protein [Planctomycetota bacterium]